MDEQNMSLEIDDFIPYVPLSRKEKRAMMWDQVFSTLFVVVLALGMGGCLGFIGYELSTLL